jgi:hypothetical protein
MSRGGLKQQEWIIKRIFDGNLGMCQNMSKPLFFLWFLTFGEWTSVNASYTYFSTSEGTWGLIQSHPGHGPCNVTAILGSSSLISPKASWPRRVGRSHRLARPAGVAPLFSSPGGISLIVPAMDLQWRNSFGHHMCLRSKKLVISLSTSHLPGRCRVQETRDEGGSLAEKLIKNGGFWWETYWSI